MRYKVNLKKTEDEALENIKDATESYLETVENGTDLRGKYCENMDYVIPAQAGIQGFPRKWESNSLMYSSLLSQV